MPITRIQIEGGFLDGFVLEPSKGLNVLIGARGTGKTSVIELIRFALAAKSHTSESRDRSASHATAILNGGEVTINLQEDDRVITVSRNSGDKDPRSDGRFTAPIVLSQTEIETLGLSEAGRLTLVDGFIKARASGRQLEAAAVGSIQSAMLQIESLQKEIDGLAENFKESSADLEVLRDLEKRQGQITDQSAETLKQQALLAQLTDQIGLVAVQEQVVDRFIRSANDWEIRLASIMRDSYEVEVWQGHKASDPLVELRHKMEAAIYQAVQSRERFKEAVTSAEEVRAKLDGVRVDLEGRSRTIRGELEKVAEGAGAIARQISLVKTNIAQTAARAALIKSRQDRLHEMKIKRDEQLGRLLELRDDRSVLRLEVIKKINEALAPHIKLSLERSSQYSLYANALVTALRGSGLRYNDLAISISEQVSPQELLAAVENADFSNLAEILEIPKERASRLIASLRDAGMGDIVTCDVEDNIQMRLLDGVEYKEITALSAGQRCTVVLSIVMQHRDRILIVDQPEDHLDNAFIANTIIKSIRERKESAQIILSTHNANIPVLGGADLVVELTSDGRHGFIEVCKPLDDSQAVTAITTVMEGGREAFNKRASFYESHDL